MAGAAARAGDAGIASLAGVAVLGSMTFPGEPGRVRDARRFVAAMLGDPGATGTAALLTSELVTNAIVHSSSGCRGGSVTIVVTEVAGGIRVEVADAGSDGGGPAVLHESYAASGHGLLLVQSLADEWGYVRDEIGTIVWFWLGSSPASG
jgi:anti-sigma regulatory factor (Ser/Thr protein kinase)